MTLNGFLAFILACYLSLAVLCSILAVAWYISEKLKRRD